MGLWFLGAAEAEPCKSCSAGEFAKGGSSGLPEAFPGLSEGTAELFLALLSPL